MITASIRPACTQNIDGLHAKAGTRELIEVHGTIAHSSCRGCGSGYQLADVRARQLADPAGVPRCDCATPLKPDVVLLRRVPARAGPAAAVIEALGLA